MKTIIELAQKYGKKYWRQILIVIGVLFTILLFLWAVAKIDGWFEDRAIRKDEKAVNKLVNQAVNVNGTIGNLTANANAANQEVQQARAAKVITQRNYDNAKKESAKARANVDRVRDADYNSISTVEANRARCAAYPSSSECGSK